MLKRYSVFRTQGQVAKSRRTHKNDLRSAIPPDIQLIPTYPPDVCLNMQNMSVHVMSFASLGFQFDSVDDNNKV